MIKVLQIVNNEVVAFECNKNKTKCVVVAIYSGYIDIEEIMYWKNNIPKLIDK